MADQLHLVPICMDALYLDQDALMAEPSVDFARLPFFNGQRDVNPDVANISENFVAPPLQNQNQLYPKGLHLHWALPDALTRGKRVAAEERSTLEFPAVPDRWLIRRTGGELPQRYWVVESNFLWPEEGQLNQIFQVERQISQFQKNTLSLLHQFLAEAWGLGRSMVLEAAKEGESLISGYDDLVDDLSELTAYAALDGLPPDERKNSKLLQFVENEKDSFEKIQRLGLLLEQSQPSIAALVSAFLTSIEHALEADVPTVSEVTAIRSSLIEAWAGVEAIKQDFILFKESELFPFAETLARLKAALEVLTISNAAGHQDLLDDTLAKMDELEQSLGASFTEPIEAQESASSLRTVQSLLGQYIEAHLSASAVFQPLFDFLELPAHDDDLTQEELQNLYSGLDSFHVQLAMVYGYLPFFQADRQSQQEAQYVQLGLLQDRLATKEAELDSFDGSASAHSGGGTTDGGSNSTAAEGELSEEIAQKNTERNAKIAERDGSTNLTLRQFKGLLTDDSEAAAIWPVLVTEGWLIAADDFDENSFNDDEAAVISLQDTTLSLPAEVSTSAEEVEGVLRDRVAGVKGLITLNQNETSAATGDLSTENQQLALLQTEREEKASQVTALGDKQGPALIQGSEEELTDAEEANLIAAREAALIAELGKPAEEASQTELENLIAEKEGFLNGADGESGKNKELADTEAALEAKEKELEDKTKELTDLTTAIAELEASIAVTDDAPGTITDIMIRKIGDAKRTLVFDETITAGGDEVAANSAADEAKGVIEAEAKDILISIYAASNDHPQGTGSLSDLVVFENELNEWNLAFQSTGVDPLADDPDRSVEDIGSDIKTREEEIEEHELNFKALAEEDASVLDYIDSVFPTWLDSTRNIIEFKLEEVTLEGEKASLEVVVGSVAAETGLAFDVKSLQDETGLWQNEQLWLELQIDSNVLNAEIAVLDATETTAGSIAEQQKVVTDKEGEVAALEAELESLFNQLAVLQQDIDRLALEIEQLENQQAGTGSSSGTDSGSTTETDPELVLKQEIAAIEESIAFLEKTIAQTAERTFEDYANKRKFSITVPVMDAWNNSGRQSYRYMGRSLTLEQYLTRPQVGQEFEGRLTAMGYGEPSFAAFYPNCRSVFGFHDPEVNGDVSTSVHYSVVGWYSHLGQDYLQSLLSAEDNPLYRLADEARWLHPVNIALADLTNVLINEANKEGSVNSDDLIEAEAPDIWDLLLTNNWLKASGNPDEAIICIQDGLPEFPDEILTRPALVEAALQTYLAAQLPADFPQEMICGAQLEFQPFATAELLLKSDFSARIESLLTDRNSTVPNLADSIELIWNELNDAHWIEVGTDTEVGRLVDPTDRVPRFLNLNTAEDISQAMVEEALRAEPATAISVTVANTSREAIAARLAHEVIQPSSDKVKELRLLEAEIEDLEAQLESLNKKEQKFGLSNTEQERLTALSNDRDAKQRSRDTIQDELAAEEDVQRPERLELEDQLEALFMTDQITDQQLDLGPKFAEARHEAGFNASNGGGQWMVRLEREGEQNAQEITEAERNRRPLPETVATALALLNDTQKQYDQAQFKIDSQRQQLFTDWYKYMMSTYPPQDSLVDFPDIDEVRYFIQEKDLRPLWNLLTATGHLLLDDPTRPSVASSELGITADDQLATALSREIEASVTTTEEHVRDLLLDFTDRRASYSFLTTAEITDWVGLISLLRNPGDSAGTQQVYDALPKDVQIIVQTADAAEPTEEEKSLLIQGLVNLLMLSTQTADALNLLQAKLELENISLSLLNAEDIKDWSAFFNALTSPPPESLLHSLRQGLSPEIQAQIDDQHSVRSQVISTFNTLLSDRPSGGRLTAVLDSIREYGQPGLLLLQFTEHQMENWEDIFSALKNRSGNTAEESLFDQLSPTTQSTIDGEDAADLAANDLARLRILKALRLMLWQQSETQAIHALNLLEQWLQADQLFDDLSPSAIRDWAGLLYELKFNQANPEIADLWASLPADLKTQLTENEVEEVLIDEAEKGDIIQNINERLQSEDFRAADQQAADSRRDEIVAANRSLLEGELGAALRTSLKGHYRLQRQSSPRYWTPKEPSVLVTGDLAEQSDRFGKDGVGTNGLLECHVVASDSVEALLSDEAGLQQLLDAMAAIDAPQWRVTGGSNPWNPFLLEWEIESCPIQFGGNSRDKDYTAQFILNNTELGVNRVDLKTTTDQFLEGNNPNIYNGRSLLTSQAAAIRDLEDRLQTFINAATSSDHEFLENAGIAQTSLATLKEKMLGQSLSGFNPAMLMLRQSYQMPVMDPIGFSEYQDFTYLVSRLVGIATKSSPQPLTDFNPIRTGKIRINQLRLIDSFGQYRQLDLYGSRHGAQLLGSSIGTTEVDGLNNRAMVELAPRLVQPTQLSFRWLAAESLVQEEAETEMNNLSETSPVCGWAMANHLDGSLMIFDGSGRSLGAIENEDEGDQAKWSPAPGLEGVEDPANIANEHLRRMVGYLRDRQAEFIAEFLDNTHRVLQSIEPETFAQQQALALLMGRPMALVRANIDLKLYGMPAVNHSWEAFYRDRLDNDESREQDHYTQVRFPIRLGAVSQLNDGLVGYWIEDEIGRYEDDLFYINLQAVDAGTSNMETWMLPDNEPVHPNFRLLEDRSTPITQSLSSEEPAVRVSMLVDPRAKVHAFTGILPTKNISIPSEHYLPALQAIDITFLTAPVLTTAEKIQVPLTDQPGFAWSWLEQLSTDNWREVHTYPTLRKDLFIDTFTRQVWDYLLRRKWVVVGSSGSNFVMGLRAERNPLSRNFESLQTRIDLALPDSPADTDAAEVFVDMTNDLRPVIAAIWENVLISPETYWLSPIGDEVAAIIPMEERRQKELVVIDPDDENVVLHDYRGLETRVEELFVRLQTSVQAPVTDAVFFTEQLWLREGWLQLKRVE